MLSASKHPLLCRPQLLPGESLSSFLVRLANINNYEPRTLSQIVRESNSSWAKKLGCPTQAYLFERIAALVCLEPIEVYRATVHHFAPVLTPPENNFETLEISHGSSVPLLARSTSISNIRPEYAGQFCPLCLEEGAYHRLIWMPIASAVCLQHNCLLVNSCPQCGNPVKVADVVEVRCHKCKASLTTAKRISIDSDDFGLFTQCTIQKWLKEGHSLSSAKYPLPQQMPRNLYYLVFGLERSLMYINPDWPLLHGANIPPYSASLPEAKARILTPLQSFCLFATAFKGLIDWPNGFNSFLTAFRNCQTIIKNNAKGLAGELGTLYERWLCRGWKLSSLEFVQEAFDQYLIENHTSLSSTKLLTRCRDKPDFAEKLDYLSVSEAAKLVSTSIEKLKLLIKLGQLASYRSGDGTSVIWLIPNPVIY